MRHILRDWFTAPDNVHYELGRALWALAFVAIVGFEGWALARGQAFDPISFGAALGAILAAGGFGIHIKQVSATKAAEGVPGGGS